jgi:ATP-dependent protease ClpP protease subunit
MRAIDVPQAVDLFHHRGVFLPTRTLYLGSETFDAEGNEGGINAASADIFVRNMHMLESLSDAPVNVLLNSVGGDEYHGLAIFDAIKCSPCRVTMTVRGHAMSMGSVILQAAAERVLGPTSTVMLHYGTIGISGHTKTVAKIAEESARLNRWMEELYLEKIRQKKPKWNLSALRHMIGHDCFMDARRAVEFGLADRIG